MCKMEPSLGFDNEIVRKILNIELLFWGKKSTNRYALFLFADWKLVYAERMKKKYNNNISLPSSTINYFMLSSCVVLCLDIFIFLSICIKVENTTIIFFDEKQPRLIACLDIDNDVFLVCCCYFLLLFLYYFHIFSLSGNQLLPLLYCIFAVSRHSKSDHNLATHSDTHTQLTKEFFFLTKNNNSNYNGKLNKSLIYSCKRAMGKRSKKTNNKKKKIIF